MTESRRAMFAFIRMLAFVLFLVLCLARMRARTHAHAAHVQGGCGMAGVQAGRVAPKGGGATCSHEDPDAIGVGLV